MTTPIQYLATIIARVNDPDDPEWTPDKVDGALTEAAQDVCRLLDVPHSAQISLMTHHDGDCPANPANGGFSADFKICTCDYVEVQVGIMHPEFLKAQLARGADKIRYASPRQGGPPMDPREAN